MSAICLQKMAADETFKTLQNEESKRHIRQKGNKKSAFSVDNLDTTPSPTGYRDYKPPAEVLGGHYHSAIDKSKPVDVIDKGSLRRKPKEQDTTRTHKVSALFAKLIKLKKESYFIPNNSSLNC